MKFRQVAAAEGGTFHLASVCALSLTPSPPLSYASVVTAISLD